MKKKILFFVFILVISLCVWINTVYATGVSDVISSMSETSKLPTGWSASGIRTGINDVIALIQIAGTGISVIVVTMLGIKYLLASPSEKADVKKQVTPILIGCVLVFGAVNIVAIITDFSGVLNVAS